MAGGWRWPGRLANPADASMNDPQALLGALGDAAIDLGEDDA